MKFVQYYNKEDDVTRLYITDDIGVGHNYLGIGHMYLNAYRGGESFLYSQPIII